MKVSGDKEIEDLKGFRGKNEGEEVQREKVEGITGAIWNVDDDR